MRFYFLERVGVGRCSEERRHVAHILVLLIWYGGGESIKVSCLPKESLWPGMGEVDGPWALGEPCTHTTRTLTH